MIVVMTNMLYSLVIGFSVSGYTGKINAITITAFRSAPPKFSRPINSMMSSVIASEMPSIVMYSVLNCIARNMTAIIISGIQSLFGTIRSFRSVMHAIMKNGSIMSIFMRSGSIVKRYVVVFIKWVWVLGRVFVFDLPIIVIGVGLV